MALEDYTPTLRNEISIDDKEIYDKHTQLIKSKKYEEAVTLLSNNKQIDSITASLLNYWEKNIYELNNIDRIFYDPYCYSQKEPSTSEMENKVIWQEEY